MYVNNTQKSGGCQAPLPIGDINNASGAPQAPLETPPRNASQTPLEKDPRNASQTPLDGSPQERPGRDWGFPEFSDAIRPLVPRGAFEDHERCGRDWECVELLPPGGGFKLNPVDSCDRWWCGHCAPQRARIQARNAFNFLSAFTIEEIGNKGPLYVRDLCKVEFTLPKILSLFLDQHPEEVNRITRMIDRLLRKFGVRGAYKYIHFSGSRDPATSHWHFHVLCWGRKHYFEPEELKKLKRGWRDSILRILSYVHKSYRDFNGGYSTQKSLFKGSVFGEELAKFRRGKKVDLHVGYFRSKRGVRGEDPGKGRSLMGYLSYQGRSFVQDLVRAVEGRPFARERLDKGLARLASINNGPYRLRRARWTGVFSSKHRAAFMESVGIEELGREECEVRKMFRFTILGMNYDRKIALCRKIGGYGEDGVYRALVPGWKFDGGAWVRVEDDRGEMTPAIFELPLDCFSFGRPVAERRFKQFIRGPPGVGTA